MEQPQGADELARASEEFLRQALRLGLGDLRDFYWYHTVELPQGLVTPGLYDFRNSLPCFRFPENMQGMTALDVGSATGFFAFEFEKRGARVVSVELPSFSALDRFPGQTVEQSIEKIEAMLASSSAGRKKHTPEELYSCLLDGPFRFCHKLLNSRVERCYSTVYELSEAKAGMAGFDLVFMGDILLHTINPLQAIAAVAPLCRGTLILSQMMPETPDGRPALIYVGGEDPAADELSWWQPNKPCLVQLLKKLGFPRVLDVGTHSGVLRPSGHPYERSIVHALKS